MKLGNPSACANYGVFDSTLSPSIQIQSPVVRLVMLFSAAILAARWNKAALNPRLVFRSGVGFL